MSGSENSRLIVRGIGAHVTDARLRDHFQAKGVVTDVKIARNRCVEGGGGRGLRPGR
jgi:hypothetical protein